MNTLSGNGLTIGQSLTPNYQMKIKPKQDIAREFFYNEDPGGVVTPRYFTPPEMRDYMRTPGIKEKEMIHFNNFIRSLGPGLDTVKKNTPMSIAQRGVGAPHSNVRIYEEKDYYGNTNKKVLPYFGGSRIGNIRPKKV